MLLIRIIPRPPCPQLCPQLCPREFEDESAETKANSRKFLLPGVRPASRAHRVLNYVLSVSFALLLLLACCAMGKPAFANAPDSASASVEATRRSATVNRCPAAASGTQIANSASMPRSASFSKQSLGAKLWQVPGIVANRDAAGRQRSPTHCRV